MLRCLSQSKASLLANFCSPSNKIFGISSKIGGASSDCLYEKYSGKFLNQDLQIIKQNAYSTTGLRAEEKEKLPGINIVTTKEECEKCVEILMRSGAVAAWDTQTMDLDVKQEAPVGKGKIICASFFAGPELDFGRGPRVFIDNFGQNAGLINYFKDYLQSQRYLKIWHNYGFDRHMFYNHGIDVRGFAGDTMHMARLLDPSKMPGNYSLSALTKENKGNIEKLSTLKIKYIKLKIMKELADEKDPARQKQLDQILNNLTVYVDYYSKSFTAEKKKMELLFGRKKMLKSGGQGITYEYPNTLTLHTNKQYLHKWIQYCVLDSQSTYFLKLCLQQKLKDAKTIDGPKTEENQKLPRTMWEIYDKYWRPFGQILTDMQREGIRVDLEYMQGIRDDAVHDLKKKQDYFLNFLASFQEDPNIDHFNPSSPLQLQQLLFAPCQLRLQQAKRLKQQQKKKEFEKLTQEERKLMQELEQSERAEDAYQDLSAKKGIRKAVTLNQLYKAFKVENKIRSKPKFVEMKIKGLNIPYKAFTPTGLPSVQEAVLQELAGDPQNEKYGTAFDFFDKKGNPQFGKQLCLALKVLVDYSSIETLLKTFIQPLISYIDHTGRVHCSLNINTQTGRLSARKPNLQNQPALDKDIYKIRKAFVASKGKKFIVADYGQLQLRVLAHLTDCQAMISAFKEGGDFHSRTAIGMYKYIKQEIDEGTILLEWDKAKGKPPVPLLKDKYASQRKKAKTVNFSIAYGKTAQGFANDWGCTLEEAKKVIQAWFDSRKEVRVWQEYKKKIAKSKHKTQTLLGRQRSLKKFYQINTSNKSLAGMGDRRAINTPIQGGAADIVIASMVKISKNQRLKELGWKLLLQIHDQLILQGPEQSAAQAFALVKYDMSHPFDFDLKIELQVDAKIGNNWYECK